MSYNTGNPIGSVDARDFDDNVKNFDRALNSTEPTWVDRLGVTRPTVPGSLVAIAADVTAVDNARIAAQSAMALDVTAVDDSRIAAQSAITTDVNAVQDARDTAVVDTIPGIVGDVVDAKNTAINTDIPGYVAAVETRRNTAINTEIPGFVNAVDASRVAAQSDIAADVAAVEAARVQAVNTAIPAAAESIKAINNRGAWATGAVYALMDIVSNGGNWYVCVVAHTASASFATDEATRWRIYQGVTAGTLAAKYSNLTGESGAKSIGVRAGTADQYLEENDTRPLAYKVGPFLTNTKSKPCRVLLMGTSIASFNSSPVQVLGQLLQSTYGQNGSLVRNLGVFGGDYTPQGGHTKQSFGGPGYVRLVLLAGGPDVVFTSACDSLNIVYSKETDGGSFEVYIDDVLDTTLSSNGAQAYEQIYTKSFSSRNVRKVTIKAPASGFGYLERMEFLNDTPGVYIENSCLGGSGLRHAYSLLPDNPLNKPGIAIVGNNGIDAFCNRTGVTKPDLIVCEHFTNDSDQALFDAGIERLVSRTKALNIPLVLLSEMPAMNAVSDGVAGEGLPGTLKTNRLGILNTILRQRDEKHVAVIDWTEMVDYSDKLAYEAKYFPTADKTHPNEAGQSVLMAALCQLFDLPSPQVLSATAISANTYQDDGAAVMPYPALADDIYSERYERFGVPGFLRGDPLHDANTLVIGSAIGMAGETRAVHFSESVPNLLPSTSFDAIRNSATKDKYGAYLVTAGSGTGIGTFRPIHGREITQDYTLLILARPNNTSPQTVGLLNSTNNLAASALFFGSARSDIASFPNIQTSAPIYFAATYRKNASDDPLGALTLTLRSMDVYGVWVVEGRVPVVTPRFLDRYRQIGFPLHMVGDLTPDLVTPGQTFTESINGVTVEKVALDAVVWKPLQSQFARAYELRNKGSITAERLAVLTPGALSYDNKVGGFVASSGSQFGRTFVVANFPYGKTFTIGFRGLATTAINIRLVSNFGNTTTFLKQDGTWETTSTVQNLTINSRFTDRLNIAITFTMPDESFAPALGTTATFLINFFGAAIGAWAPAFICEGSSACVSAASAMDTGPDKDVGAAAPTSGYYPRGFIRYNSAPAPGGTLGWVCTTAGIAGSTAVFKTFGVISA